MSAIQVNIAQKKTCASPAGVEASEQFSRRNMNINRSVLKPIVPQNFSAEPDDEIDILALVRTLWRERSVIILFAAFTMTAGIYFAYFRTVPHYKATTTVVLEDRQQNMVDLPSGLGNLSQWDDATIQTEIAVLTSRNLVKKVVLDLDLIRNPGFNWTLVAQEPSYFDNLDRLKKTWLEKMGPSTTKEMPGVRNIRRSNRRVHRFAGPRNDFGREPGLELHS